MPPRRKSSCSLPSWSRARAKRSPACSWPATSSCWRSWRRSVSSCCQVTATAAITATPATAWSSPMRTSCWSLSRSSSSRPLAAGSLTCAREAADRGGTNTRGATNTTKNSPTARTRGQCPASHGSPASQPTTSSPATVDSATRPRRRVCSCPAIRPPKPPVTDSAESLTTLDHLGAVAGRNWTIRARRRRLAPAMNQRLRALCDLSMGSAREYVGLHQYDGRIEDLSPDGVRAALARVGDGPPTDDPHDEAHLAAFERLARLELGELELHRANPLYHIAALDVSSYDREYAPAAERAEARRRHLAAWPDAVDAAVEALDRVPAPVAGSLLAAAKGLIADLEGSGEPQRGAPVNRDPDESDVTIERALAAHGRLVAHLEAAAKNGPPDAALGRGPLERLLSTGEALEADLGRLEERADAERDRLRALLDDACGRLAPGRPTTEVVGELLTD